MAEGKLWFGPWVRAMFCAPWGVEDERDRFIRIISLSNKWKILDYRTPHGA